MPYLHELLEDRLQLGIGDLAAVNVEGTEVPAVHQVAQPRVGAPVGRLRIGRQLDCDVDALGNLTEIGFQSLAQLLNRCALASQPALLVVEQVGADAVGVVRFEQLALLGFDPGEGAFSIAQILVADVRQLLQAGHQLIAQDDALGFRQRDAPVEPLHRHLDIFQAVVGLLARTVLLADAEEVLVMLAELASIAAVEQPRSAATAEQGAGQVVVVLPGARAVLASRFQDLLHTLEQRFRHQRLVAPSVRLAADHHQTDVVLVAQHR